MILVLKNIEAAGHRVRQKIVVKKGLTPYGGLWHHSGNVLGPVEWD